MFAGPWPGQSWAAYAGGRSLSVTAWLTTGRYLTDTVTAYKLFPRPLLAGLDLQTTGFELDHEISAKVIAQGLPDRRGADRLRAPLEGRRQENRRARLVAGPEDLLALPPRLIAAR